MKLPWDKNYIKIAFHVVVTVIIIYALKYCVDFLAYTVTNLDQIFMHVGNFFDWLFSVGAVLVIAFVISYILDPVVDMFQNKYDYISNRYILPKIKNNKKIKDFILKSRVKKRKKENNAKNKIIYKKRTAGTVITFLVIIFILYIFVNYIVGEINNTEGNDVIDSTINFVNDTFNDFSKTYANLETKMKDYGVFEYAEKYIHSFTSEFTKFVSNIGNGMVDFIYSFGTGFLNVLIGFVIAFYFLRDKEVIKHKFSEIFKTFTPNRFSRMLLNAIGDVDAVFSGYIRGQVIDASIMSILISVGLSIVDVDFAIIIGIVSGFANVIPYFGAFVAFVLAVFVTLLSGTPIKALYAAIIILILQQLDGVVIGPKVVGENVKLSPVLVIIALTVSAELFGLWGMVLAVPVFATIKLFAERFYARQKNRRESKLTTIE